MHNEWENRFSSQDIRYSRYIASYMKELSKAGKRFYSDEFADWLLLIGLSSDEINDIVHLADCGKMELELKAQAYIKSVYTD